MRGERLWGCPIWVWYLQGAVLTAAVLLLIGSLTVSGRVFAVMLMIAQTFVAMRLYVAWIRSQLPSPDQRYDNGSLPPV